MPRRKTIARREGRTQNTSADGSDACTAQDANMTEPEAEIMASRTQAVVRDDIAYVAFTAGTKLPTCEGGKEADLPDMGISLKSELKVPGETAGAACTMHSPSKFQVEDDWVIVEPSQVVAF
mmetsp:Transcript_64435/g.119850  ORF Transcript_64435/g.119850 Transcript_64435/m.119850 type:complete len:122 (-) Transcript_64435:260-625(-)